MNTPPICNLNGWNTRTFCKNKRAKITCEVKISSLLFQKSFAAEKYRHFCFKNHFQRKSVVTFGSKIIFSRKVSSLLVQKSFARISCVKKCWKMICGNFLCQEMLKNDFLEILASRMVEKWFSGNSCVKNGWKIICGAKVAILQISLYL